MYVQKYIDKLSNIIPVSPWVKETVERSHGETLYVLKPK
jgi:hypothetical protein